MADEYNVPVPDSLKAKGPRPGRPRKVVVPVVAPADVMPAPKVVLDARKYRVRLRGASLPLPITIMNEKEEIRVTLQPNRWQEVPKPVYDMLKQKFGKTVEHEVPHLLDNGETFGREVHTEQIQAPIIEGL